MATPVSFPVDQSLLDGARSVLEKRDDVHWVVGGACTGKSTVCEALADSPDIQRIDMDQRIYGGFSFDPTRHPATSTWFSADSPLAWVMSLSWPEFDALNRATNAEYLDLLAEELSDAEGSGQLLVDGGFTHPSVLARVVAPARIVCLATSAAQSARCWETAEDRAQMRKWIRELPEPAAMWAKFLDFDRSMSEVMVEESRELGIEVVVRGPGLTVDGLRRVVAKRLGM